MLKLKHFVVAGCTLLLLSGCAKTDIESIVSNDESIPALVNSSTNNKYIVVLDEAVNTQVALSERIDKVKGKAIGLLKKYNIDTETEETYQSALNGFTVRLNKGQAKQLADDPEVKIVEQDQFIVLSPINATGKPAPTPVAQSVPWGITRVGGGGTASSTATAWIIDSGIDLDHPDLNVDVARSRSFVTTSTTPDDQNGHGTHVAGTIGAINNTIGVVGVVPGVKLVSVRVLDRKGSGTTAGVIAGVDYVKANGKAGDVANMSLGGGISDALDLAVLNASAVVKFALAAGNESDNANNHSPARVNGPNIFTVSAMSSTDSWASFSNYGNPPIDFCAPGVSVYSTYKDGGYATLSGTSMACPHVAGLLLLGNINIDGYVKGDPDGNADPIAHR